MNLCRITLLIALLALPWIGLSSQDGNSPSPPLPPPEYREMLRLDREKNVHTRQGQILKGEDLKAKKVFEFEIPEDKLKLHFGTDVLDAESKKWVEVVRDNKKFYKIFVLEENKPLIEALSKDFTPTQRLWALRLQSHSSHFCLGS